MKKITILFFISLVTVFSNASVLKTGQTHVFEAGDDGSYQKGMERRYSREDGVVKDLSTGLMWQDDIKTALMNWQDAQTYCSTLTLGTHRDWRLPTIEELKTLSDKSKSNVAIDTHFRVVSAQNYWSSTSFSGDVSSAWGTDFLDGYDHIDTKITPYPVRCVRGSSLVVGERFSRNNAREVVYDHSTKLTWQDSGDVGANALTWSSGIGYCEKLALAGVGGWRLPNMNELSSLINFQRNDPAMDETFHYRVAGAFWSTTAFAGSAPDVKAHSDAWVVDFKYGYNNAYNKSNRHHIRCVRDGRL